MSGIVMPLINGIPAIGLGTYPLAGAECTETVLMAIEVGYRHIDTAQMYGNEREVGQALARAAFPRNQLFVTTKIDPSNATEQRFLPSARKSVEALGGPVDLLLIHWPPADSQIPRAIDLLAEAKNLGLARRIGVSNFTPRMLRLAKQRLGNDVACNQVEFQPLLDQKALKTEADALGIPLVAYSPIARGKAIELPVVQEIAGRLKRPPSEIVLRWIVQQGVIAVPMTRKRQNAVSNLNAITFELGDDDMKRISAIGTRHGRTVNSSLMSGRWDD